MSWSVQWSTGSIIMTVWLEDSRVCSIEWVKCWYYQQIMAISWMAMVSIVLHCCWVMVSHLSLTLPLVRTQQSGTRKAWYHYKVSLCADKGKPSRNACCSWVWSYKHPLVCPAKRWRLLDELSWRTYISTAECVTACHATLDPNNHTLAAQKVCHAHLTRDNELFQPP